MRRLWAVLGVCAVVGSLGSAQQGVPEWLQNAVWLRTYLSGQSLAYEPNAKLLASPAGFGQIFLYRADDGTFVRALRGHTDMVTSVAFSPDGKWLASGDRRGVIRIWNVADGTIIREWAAHGEEIIAVLFSPDGSLLVSATDRVVNIWRTGDWSLVHQIVQKEENRIIPGVSAIAFSPDGKLLAIGDYLKTRVIQVSDWKEVLRLRRAEALAFSPDGRYLAMSEEEDIAIVSLSDGKALRILRGHKNIITCLAFSHDGKLLASASVDRTIALWNPSLGQVLRTMTRHTDTVNAVLFSEDDRQLFSVGNDRAIRVWQVVDGREMRHITGDLPGPAYKIAVSSDGQLVATILGAEIKLLDLRDGQVVRTIAIQDAVITDVEFSPAGQFLAASLCTSRSPEPESVCLQGEIRLWNVADGQVVRVWGKEHRAPITEIEFSPDGQMLVSVDVQSQARLWRVSTGEEVWKLEDVRAPAAFSPNGKVLALVSSNGITLWRVEDQQIIIVISNFEVKDMIFSADGQMLITNGGEEGDEIRFWDVATGKLLRRLTWHTWVVLVLGLSSKGDRLVSGSADRTIKLWRMEDGSLIGSLFGYTGGVTSVAFSPDDKFVISGGEDGIAVWDVDALR
jgi:WD40 repeat protein